MKFISDDLLRRAADGDIDTLVRLDDHGLIIGPDESTEEFIYRVETLRKNIAELEDELKEKEVVPLYGVTLNNRDAIPKDVFKSAGRETKRLFGFTIDWVPGFFTNDRMGILFAGCAMYSYEDFFAVFLVRKSFQNSEKWLIYRRRELMAHELTHIAHIGFQTPNYEEHFAFQTSDSGFRKKIGGLFRTPKDTFLTLGAVVALALTQFANAALSILAYKYDEAFYHTAEHYCSLATPYFFLAAFACIGSVIFSYLRSQKVIKRAQANLITTFKKVNPLPILFRCSNDEIDKIAALKPNEVEPWIANQAEKSARWGVIRRKFVPKST